MLKNKIKVLDFIGAIIILLSLYLVTINPVFWLLYSIGCLIWIYLMYNKKLYSGLVMNAVASTICIVNYIRSLV